MTVLGNVTDCTCTFIRYKRVILDLSYVTFLYTPSKSIFLHVAYDRAVLKTVIKMVVSLKIPC